MKQEQALDILKTGGNVFLTGEPGSGKTHTINRYIVYLRACGIEPAVTASTAHIPFYLFQERFNVIEFCKRRFSPLRLGIDALGDSLFLFRVDVLH